MSSDDSRMARIKIAPSYDEKWLEIERPQPLCDNYLESLFDSIATGFNGTKIDHSLQANDTFKQNATSFIFGSCLNTLTGIDKFPYVDLIIGCTQFIDNLYMKNDVQVLAGDYKYHQRLGNIPIDHFSSLTPETPLILSLPLPSGVVHPNIDEILDFCYVNRIPVHIDGAWITCSKDLYFNFDHPAIQSIGISLSKGLGLGWNRIGLRWSRQKEIDSISIMNDFHMECRMLTIIGNYILEHVEKDYLWYNYANEHRKICRDFNLAPTNAVHIAKTSKNITVGISPLLRYLKNESDRNC